MKPRLSDGGQAQSRFPARRTLEGVCGVRALALAAGCSFDCAFEALWAWDSGEMGHDGLIRGDGIHFEQWARKVGFLEVPSDAGGGGSGVSKNSGPILSGHVASRYRCWLQWHSLSFGNRDAKGTKRYYPSDIPKLYPKGRFIANTEAHVEAWIDGVWWDRRGIEREVKPKRVVYGLWEVHTLEPGQALYLAQRVYILPERGAFQSALGPVAGSSLEEAYRTAEGLYGHRLRRSKSDLLLRELVGAAA